jgi:hypothetical protein
VWGDLYPAWQWYADECERLLSFLAAHGELDRFWPRLRSRRQQRDEALNEIRVGYFLDSTGYPVVGWELMDAAPYNVEFAVALGQASKVLVEVKSPGWEAELLRIEQAQGRTKQEKYMDLDARAARPVDVIRRTTTKALPKFTGTAPSLIVISDDCFVNLGEWGWGPLAMALTQRSIAYGPGLFHDPACSTIGGVCLFWLSRANEEGVGYASLCMANPNALPSAALPPEMVTRICTTPVEPVPHLIQPGTGVRF